MLNEKRKAAARAAIETKLSRISASTMTIAACQGITDHLIDTGESAGSAIEKAYYFGGKLISAGMSMCKA